MANKINLGNGIISNSPGTSGTSFEVSGYGAVMPGAQFYATATPPGQLSTMGNSEIVLVTAKATDTLTVTRAQKSTTAQDVQAGWILSNGIYVEDLAEKLNAASNLSDLASAATSRTNLGLGSLAVLNAIAIANITASGTPSSSTYLRGDGTWNTPTNTTYTEITTAEIDAGTASTLRTITGRRVQYIKDWVTAAIATMKAGLTKSDVGLGNVDNITQNSITGWNAISATLTYASADSPTFVANTSTDLRGSVGVGNKIRLTQTTDKYFVVTAITATTITLFGGTDYTLANSTITSPSYSNIKNPLGFNLNPSKWAIIVSDSGTIRQQVGATHNVWYELYSGLRPVVPIGLWIPKYTVKGQLNHSIATSTTVLVTLSTGSATESDTANTSSINGASTANGCSQTFEKELLPVELTSKTTFYLNTKGQYGSGTTTIYNRADDLASVIKFYCAYI